MTLDDEQRASVRHPGPDTSPREWWPDAAAIYAAARVLLADADVPPDEREQVRVEAVVDARAALAAAAEASPVIPVGSEARCPTCISRGFKPHGTQTGPEGREYPWACPDCQGTGHRPQVSNRSTGGEVVLRYADLCLGTFGAINPTPEDRIALAEHLSLGAARWINDRYGIGLPERGDASRFWEGRCREATSQGLCYREQGHEGPHWAQGTGHEPDDGSCRGDCTATTAPNDYVPCPDCGAACGHGYCRPCEPVIPIRVLREWVEEWERVAEMAPATHMVANLAALLDEHAPPTAERRKEPSP